MKNFFAALEKYLGLAIAGIHAANSVQGASNADKKATVLATITGISDAIAQASGNPQIQAASQIIDIAATVINVLTSKTAAAAPQA